MARYRIAIRSNADVARAVTQARSICTALEFDAMRIAQVGTAVSEIATNALKYARDGVVDLARIELSGRIGFEVLVVDDGPGIADVDAAFAERFSTGNSLGMGLAGARRLMDEMHIHSTPGAGTRVVMRKWS